MHEVTIAGAGLAGCMIAVYLAKRGYQVTVYESRPDLRLNPIDFGRSINLALSTRGITSLEEIGVLDKVRQITVPMRARAIHENDCSMKYQAFGRHHDEYINAIKRSELNGLLLDELAHYPKATVYFEHKITKVDVNNQTIELTTPANLTHTVKFKHLIGADGAGSNVRNALVDQDLVTFSKKLLSHSYKELLIPAIFGRDMEHEHLHIWPRDSFMLLGNPNIDGSITGSLFLANHGDPSFDSLTTDQQVTEFFQRYFPDAYDKMPHLTQEFFENPTGQMGTINCEPWYYKERVLLIGDAAHGIVPFFGQGMNCAFEDCRILNKLCDQYQDNWQDICEQFYLLRKPDTEAVAEMSMDNYREIQHEIRDHQFVLRKTLEQALMHRYPDQYISKHILVMFTTAPYSYAYICGELQQALLHQICDPIDSLAQVDWQSVEKNLDKYVKKLTEFAASTNLIDI